MVPGAVRGAVEYHCSLGANLRKHTAQLGLHLIVNTVMKYVFVSLFFSCFKLVMLFFEIPFYRLPSLSFVCRQAHIVKPGMAWSSLCGLGMSHYKQLVYLLLTINCI